MVVFTCNHCGDSLQKPRVEKHYSTTCRKNSKSLTCVDCLKDFRLEEYAAHTKCITETERYSAKGTVINASKGEKKQKSWIETVRSVIEEEKKNFTGNVYKVFEVMEKHNNIPKRKKPFLNFLSSASGYYLGVTDIETVWNMLETKIVKNEAEKNETDNKNESKKSRKRQSKLENVNEDENIPEKKLKIDEIVEENIEKSAKKKRKQKQIENNETNELQNGENKIESNETIDSSEKSKKKKKRKSKTVENGQTTDENKTESNGASEETTDNQQNGENNTESEEKPKKKKKRKSQSTENGETKENNNTQSEIVENIEINDDTDKSKKKKRKSQVENGETNENNNTQSETVENIEINDDTDKSKKKKKRKSHVANGETNEKQEESPEMKVEENGVVKESFSWEVIREILAKKPEGITKDKLESKVFKKYEKANGEISEKGKKNFAKKYNKKLRSLQNVVYDNDLVKLNA